MAQSEHSRAALPAGAAAADTRVLTAHVPVALADQVDQIAARLERSRGWVIKQALSDWVALEQERSALTNEALDDAATGRLVEHQAVLDWADSLGGDTPLPAPIPSPAAR